MEKLFLLILISACFRGSTQAACGEPDFEASKYDSVTWRWRVTGYVGSPMNYTSASYVVLPGNPQTHDVVSVPWKMSNSSAVTSNYVNPNAHLDVQIEVLTLPNKTTEHGTRSTEHVTKEMDPVPTPINVTRTDSSTDGFEIYAVKWPVLNINGGRDTNKMTATVFETLPSGKQSGCTSSTLLQNDTVMVYEYYLVVYSKVLPTSETSGTSAPVTMTPVESTTSGTQGTPTSLCSTWVMFILTLFLFN